MITICVFIANIVEFSFCVQTCWWLNTSHQTCILNNDIIELDVFYRTIKLFVDGLGMQRLISALNNTIFAFI